MSVSLPVMALTLLGILITVLAFLGGGNVPLVVVGLAAIAVAGVLAVVGNRRT